MMMLEARVFFGAVGCVMRALAVIVWPSPSRHRSSYAPGVAMGGDDRISRLIMAHASALSLLLRYHGV